MFSKIHLIVFYQINKIATSPITVHDHPEVNPPNLKTKAKKEQKQKRSAEI